MSIILSTGGYLVQGVPGPGGSDPRRGSWSGGSAPRGGVPGPGSAPRGVDHPSLTATVAGSTHPTGMHSCFKFFHCSHY